MTTTSVTWAQTYLIENGYEDICQPDLIREMPWSSITQFSTSGGPVFLKEMAEPFSREPLILNLIESVNVPTVICHNKELSCFLMNDAGHNLREQMKKKFEPSLLWGAMTACAQIQLASIPQIDNFLAAGIPDWRLANLPRFFEAFLDQEDLLLGDGLSQEEINILRNQNLRIQEVCARLGSYGIPETLEHGDFHDNNILVNSRVLTLSDWGDASISHPFFSCVSALDSAQRNHKYVNNDEARDAYLEKWLDYGEMKILCEAFSLAQIVRPVVFSLSLSRIKLCPKIKDFPQFQGLMAKELRAILAI